MTINATDLFERYLYDEGLNDYIDSSIPTLEGITKCRDYPFKSDNQLSELVSYYLIICLQFQKYPLIRQLKLQSQILIK